MSEDGPEEIPMALWPQARAIPGAAERIAMIGDSLQQDALAPRSFGVQAVWFNEGGRQAGAPSGLPVVTRLEQFAGMIRCPAPSPR